MDYPDGETVYERFARQGVLTHSQIVEAMENTNRFLSVEEYDGHIFDSTIKMPTMYPGWTQEEKDQEYRRVVQAGWDAYKIQISSAKIPLYEDEIEKEVRVVETTGMADYFLINHSVIKKGIENGGVLTTTGRGSAVSWTNKLLGFTEVDRIAASVKMYPDRFMSAARILQSGSLPDIDFNVADAEPFARAQKEILGDDHAYDLREVDYRVMAQNQLDILGYVDMTTGKPEDRRKLFIRECYAIENRWGKSGGVWKYKVNTMSIGSGRTASLTLDPKLYSAKPVKAGDIILCTRDPYKDEKGYWHLIDYEYI